MDTPRLIENAFPLKQTSLDSVHEKNVRHGHLSTLHIWPARRPLAACRAALIATLLPDPGTAEARQALCERIGGKLIKKIEKKRMPDGRVVERVKEVTEGGILHWGRETEAASELEWFRREIRKAYGGRAPRVLDPFAGGGAIPLEAMRLGCETTAADINPVAWFLLKCTLEYPQQFAGKTFPLPDFALQDPVFMKAFREAQARPVRKADTPPKRLRHDPDQQEIFSRTGADADLAWHVRAWGKWVLDRTRRDLARFYPTYADWESQDRKGTIAISYERQPCRLVPLQEDGTLDLARLNEDLSADYLANPLHPRWVPKPTVAYLWARTVTCKNCRSELPLLKTRWLCKKDDKRVLLTMEPRTDGAGVVFGVQKDVPISGGNAAQRRENDKRLGAGTMSRSGSKCPCCATIMTSEDIRLEGRAGRLGETITAVVLDGPASKEYRLPTEHERDMAREAADALPGIFASVPFGAPDEPVPAGSSRKGGGSAFTTVLYGLDRWSKLYSARQLLSLATLSVHTRELYRTITNSGFDNNVGVAIQSFLALALDRIADRGSTLASWDMGRDTIRNTFARFALPITWDFCEGVPFSEATGGYPGAVDWISLYIGHALVATDQSPSPSVLRASAISDSTSNIDIVVTDPPYYDAIPYSDIMDYFYVWLRRTLYGLTAVHDLAFREPLSPKWDHASNDGELVDDSGRHGGDHVASKRAYEEGMERAFVSCNRALQPNGRLVIVFAHKHPDAWETLVAAIIRAGFVVDGSWPIQTEMGNRTRALTSAALSSSVWLVCRKRPDAATPGWDTQVLADMRDKLHGRKKSQANDSASDAWEVPPRLREFWDAGIRGPDFVWAATGPALEAYSQHPFVRKANEPGPLTVSEFLGHVRRLVVDFVVGRVLTGDHAGEEATEADRLDEPTSYYLLHRHDFGLDDAPVGACILYAVSCGLSDRVLADTWDLIAYGKGKPQEDEDEEADTDGEPIEDDGDDTGSKVRLKAWNQRRARSMGYDAPGGRPIPLIDRVHRLMHLWHAGDANKVDEYLDDHGLRRHELFKRLLQSLIELSATGSEERALLESLSNHLQARGALGQGTLGV